MNPYRNAAKKLAADYGQTLGQWTKGYTWSDAARLIDLAKYANSPEEAARIGGSAALWMWYQAGRVAKGRLTINASELPINDVNTWQRSVKYVWHLGCYPDVYASCRPYQLVLS